MTSPVQFLFLFGYVSRKKTNTLRRNKANSDTTELLFPLFSFSTNHHTEDMQVLVNSVSSFITLQISYVRNTRTLVFLQADLKQTLYLIQKQVQVKIFFKEYTAIKPVTYVKNTVVIRPHSYVTELYIMLTQNCLKKSFMWYTLLFAALMDVFKSLYTLNKE